MLWMHYVQCALWTQRVFGAVSRATHVFVRFGRLHVIQFLLSFQSDSSSIPFWRLSFWSQIFLWCNTMGWLIVGRFRQFRPKRWKQKRRQQMSVSNEKARDFHCYVDVARCAHIYCALESHTMRQRCCETCSLWFVCCRTSDVCEWRRKRMCIHSTYILKGEASAVYKFVNYYFVANPPPLAQQCQRIVNNGPFEKDSDSLREGPKLWFCMNFDIDIAFYVDH